jgi:NAD(P)-dependent dehydrogenase (short-subunit alcohol dehydrogenase family)
MLPAYGAYCATKGAVEQLTRVFSKEVRARNITVNSISPDPTNTELFTEGKSQEVISRLAGMAALGRIGEPIDITSIVLFLVGEEASWVTGTKYWCKRSVRLTSMSSDRFLLRVFVRSLRYIFSQNHSTKNCRLHGR